LKYNTDALIDFCISAAFINSGTADNAENATGILILDDFKLPDPLL
jgi:hypothetical protein